MINRIFEALATFSDVAYMVWFIPAFLHVSRLRDIKPYIYAVPALMLAFEYSADESDIIGLSQKAFKHLDASMMI